MEYKKCCGYKLYVSIFRSLVSLPDISKWDTKNVTNMSYIFSYCSSLVSLPDISKWEINKSLETENMFEGVDKKIIPKILKG